MHLPSVPTATMATLRMRARLMATMDRATSQAASSSVPALGSTVTMAAAATTAVASTDVLVSPAVLASPVALVTSGAAQLAARSAAATHAVEAMHGAAPQHAVVSRHVAAPHVVPLTAAALTAADTGSLRLNLARTSNGRQHTLSAVSFSVPKALTMT